MQTLEPSRQDENICQDENIHPQSPPKLTTPTLSSQPPTTQLTTNYNTINKQIDELPPFSRSAWLRVPKSGLRVRQNGFNVH